MTVLRALFDRRSVENPSRPLTDSSLVELLGGVPVEAGVTVNPESALTLSAVYRAIALLAGVIGSLPLHSYRRRSDGGREQAASPAIDNPHPDSTPLEVWEYAGVSLFSHGNSYQFKRRDGLGRIRELEPFHPATMRVERKREWVTAANPSGKRFFESTAAGEKMYTPYDVLHIPGLSYNGVFGLSPIGAARQSLGLSMAAQRFGARMFARGALIDGVLTSDQSIDEDAAKKLKRQWKDKAAGADRQWDIPVLHSGLRFERIGLPPQDAQFIETQRFGIQDVARWYGLPPHLLADVERSTSWGTGIEQQNMQMLIFTLDPWLVRIEQRVSREVVMDSSQYVKFNRGALLRADTASRYMAYQRAANNGWLNADEIRELEERDPLPDGLGQMFYRPGNLLPVGTDPEGAANGAT